MVRRISLTSTKEPEAFITSGKNRLPLDSNKIYVKNDTEFEIELFNPSTLVYAAKISLNEQPISDDWLIIKPGQRLFLERYLNESKKFKFSAYEVDNTKETEAARESNGLVKVEFYKEDVNPGFYSSYIYTPPTVYINQPYWYGGSTITSSSSCFFSSTTSNSDESVETGRVEKGEESSQELYEVSGYKFNIYPEKTIEYQLLPLSLAPPECGTVYCTKCAYKKRKDTWVFCPKCGTQYS